MEFRFFLHNNEEHPKGKKVWGDAEAEDAERCETYTLTHEWVGLHTRSAHSVTISSCQGRQFEGSLALYDTRHRMWSRRHIYTALSRARSWDALSIED